MQDEIKRLESIIASIKIKLAVCARQYNPRARKLEIAITDAEKLRAWLMAIDQDSP